MHLIKNCYFLLIGLLTFFSPNCKLRLINKRDQQVVSIHRNFDFRKKTKMFSLKKLIVSSESQILRRFVYSRLKNQNLLTLKKKSFPVISSQEFLKHSDDPTSTVHINNQNRHKEVFYILYFCFRIFLIQRTLDVP